MMNIYDILEVLDRIENKTVAEAELGDPFMPGIENTPEYKKGFETGALPVPYPEGTQQYANYYKGVIAKVGPKGFAENSKAGAITDAGLEESIGDLPKTTTPDQPWDVPAGTNLGIVFEPGKKSGVHYALMVGMVNDPYYFRLNNKVYQISMKGDGIPTPAQGMAEGTFAGTKVGQKPGDQVRGTEVAKKKKSGEHPFKGRLVGTAESINREFKTYLEDIIAEYGMTTSDSPQDKQAQIKTAADTTASINKLKTAGVNIPNVQQAVKSTLKDPTKDQMSPQDKDVAAGLGQEVQDIIDQGGPAVDQLVGAVKKAQSQKQQVGGQK